ncbi:hypothetical protein D9M72_410810 [compost metagenome]
MVLRLEIGELAGFADGLDHDVVVLAAFGNAVFNQVGDTAEQFLLPGLGDVRLSRSSLDRCGQDFDLCQQGLLFIALGLRHLLAERILLGAEVFEADQSRTPCRVCRDDRIHHGLVGAAGALAGTELVRIFAEVFYVDHQTRVSNPPAMTRWAVRTPGRTSARDSVGAP